MALLITGKKPIPFYHPSFIGSINKRQEALICLEISLADSRQSKFLSVSMFDIMKLAKPWPAVFLALFVWISTLCAVGEGGIMIDSWLHLAKLLDLVFIQDSRNLTIFKMIHWVAGSIVSLTKCVMVQVFFWLIENKTVGCWLGLHKGTQKSSFFVKEVKK